VHDVNSVMARLQAWSQEREALARDLRSLADSLGAAVLQGPPPSLAPLQGVAAADGGMVSSGRKAKKRTMSPEARAKIAEAQRRRWAAQKQGGAARKAKAKKRGGDGAGNG
jgi:hypothetical protein